MFGDHVVTWLMGISYGFMISSYDEIYHKIWLQKLSKAIKDRDDIASNLQSFSHFFTNLIGPLFTTTLIWKCIVVVAILPKVILDCMCDNF